MMRTVLTVAFVLCVALAGCSDGGGGGPDPSFTVPPPAAGKGLIMGVVVNEALSPLAGATVEVISTQLTQETDADGRFVFSDVDPGTYFVSASKPGYATAQQSVEVQADHDDPPTLKVFLARMPGTEPMVDTEKWTGFIECSVRAGTGPADQGSVGVNACDDTGNQNVNYVTSFERTPDFIQAELVWQSTQTLGSGLSLVVGPESCEDVKYGRSDGASPRILPLNRTALEAEGIGAEAGLCYRVFAWTADESQGTAGATVSQEFEVVFNHFYNFLPAEGWTFTEDGPHPVPE